MSHMINGAADPTARTTFRQVKRATGTNKQVDDLMVLMDE
jgi:hypothetical protein